MDSAMTMDTINLIKIRLNSVNKYISLYYKEQSQRIFTSTSFKISMYIKKENW